MSVQFTPELWDTLSSDEITAIELAYKHNKVTTKMLEDELDRGPKFVRKILNKLKEKKFLSGTEHLKLILNNTILLSSKETDLIHK